jgi:hypothetical protein
MATLILRSSAKNPVFDKTLESLSSDVQSTNMVRTLFPGVSTVTWESATVSLLFPLTLLRSYKILAFTSAFGVLAVLGGLLVTLASRIMHYAWT